MSNLKKILALVLALVMSFSLVTVASAAESTEEIKAEYADSVKILNYLGVFRGYEDDTFKPQNSITRAEVAAIIYRIDTGDVSDEQVKIYADYNRFDDVKSTSWYAGYVNYCANAEYIKGYDEKTFGPNDKVTGYQALAMILRAVGYDKNNEFSGSAWQIEVAKYANKLGITANVNANTLGVAATRELIAELLWRTVYEVPQVTYTPALGYNQYQDTLHNANSKLNDTINDEKFGVYEIAESDEWGRPYTRYYPYWNPNYTILVKEVAPVYTGYTAMTECEVYDAMGLRKDATFDVYENANLAVKFNDAGAIVDNYRTINKQDNQKTNPAHLIGEQGTQIELYYGYDNLGNWISRIVLVDTYLAKVTGQHAEKVDKAGHKYIENSNSITVYTHDGDKMFNTVYANGQVVKYGVKYGTYAVNSYILTYVNNSFGWHYVLDANGEKIPVLDQYGKETGAYQWVYDFNGQYVDVTYTREPAVVVGRQSTVKFNSGKHYIEKVEYADNANFVRDDAGYDKSMKYSWYFDEQNNVMGAVTYTDAKQYAVVSSAQWVNGVGATGYAQATLTYIGGETVTATILAVNDKAAHYVDSWTVNGIRTVDFNIGEFSTTYQYNNQTADHLYQVVETPYGLYLYAVTNEFVNDGANAAWLKKGVSAVKSGAMFDDDYANYAINEFYTDNTTIYVYWEDQNYDGHEETLIINEVTGYENLPYEQKGVNIDVVYNYGGYEEFAGIVYIPQNCHVGIGDNTTTESFVYITDKAMTHGLGYNNVTYVSGVIAADGNTDPLMFWNGQYGSEIATQATLDAMVELYKDSLVKVTTDAYGYVVAVTPVLKGNDTLNNKAPYDHTAMYVADGSYFFAYAGVIKVGALALNVNASTVIINDDGTGITVNDLMAITDKDLYVVYRGTTAKAIFVVGELNNLNVTFAELFNGLTADSFAVETATQVYKLTADAEGNFVTEVEFLDSVIANSVMNNVFGMSGEAFVIDWTAANTTYAVVNNKLVATLVLSYEVTEGVFVNKTVTLAFNTIA